MPFSADGLWSTGISRLAYCTALMTPVTCYLLTYLLFLAYLWTTLACGMANMLRRLATKTEDGLVSAPITPTTSKKSRGDREWTRRLRKVLLLLLPW